jgi:AcrR family transcriptional regulator
MTNASSGLSCPERHQPKQNRSVETRNSILKAAAELFAAQGYEKTNTHQIAAQAQVSVGALYRYFSDKEALLKELYRREVSEVRDRILADFMPLEDISEDTIRGMVRRALALAFQVFSERPALRQVLSEQSRKIPELAQLRRQQERELHETVNELFASVPELGLPDIGVSAYLITLFLEKLVEDFHLNQQNGLGLSRERVLDGGADFIIRYLRLEDAPLLPPTP